MSHFNKSIIINGYDNDNALAVAIGFTCVCFLNGSKKFVAKYTISITVVLNLILLIISGLFFPSRKLTISWTYDVYNYMM